MKFVKDILQKEIDKLTKDNERLLHQIETCEDMIHNYQLCYHNNLEKVEDMIHLMSIMKKD